MAVNWERRKKSSDRTIGAGTAGMVGGTGMVAGGMRMAHTNRKKLEASLSSSAEHHIPKGGVYRGADSVFARRITRGGAIAGAGAALGAAGYGATLSGVGQRKKAKYKLEHVGKRHYGRTVSEQKAMRRDATLKMGGITAGAVGLAALGGRAKAQNYAVRSLVKAGQAGGMRRPNEQVVRTLAGHRPKSRRSLSPTRGDMSIAVGSSLAAGMGAGAAHHNIYRGDYKKVKKSLSSVSRAFRPVGHASNLKDVRVGVGAGRKGLHTTETWEKPGNWAWRGARQTTVTNSDPMGGNTFTRTTSLPGGLTAKGKKARNVTVGTGAVTAYGAGVHHEYKAQKKKVQKSMTASVWGVDHGADEIAKFTFKPVLNTGKAAMGALKKPTVAGPPKVPSVQNGLKQIGGMAKPKGVPMGASQSQMGGATSRIQARSRFNAGQQSALGQRLGVKKNLDAGVSVWGVNHGDEVAKADTKQKEATPGRYATGMVFPGFHGAVAGRKGKKLRAAGNEFGLATVGGIAGAGLTRGSHLGTTAGQYLGAAGGVHRSQRKGYYKPQS